MVCMNTATYTPYWRTRTYSKEDLIEAWNTSTSIAECARKLGLTANAGYKTVAPTAKFLGLTDKHMSGQKWAKDTAHSRDWNKRPIEYYLVVNGQASSSFLKERLLREELLEPKCSAPHCPHPVTTIDGLTGEEKPTPLTLDHINGINNDNRLENLRLLCANCDRFNPTFCRGNKDRKKQQSYTEKHGLDLCECGGKKNVRAKKCKICENIRRKKDASTKIDWPADEELLQMVKNTSYLATGKFLGVSDTAVRKRLKNRGII